MNSIPASQSRTGLADSAPARRLVLHCPDITLKGRNREDFQQALDDNVRHVLRRAGLTWRVGSARGRVYVDVAGSENAGTSRAVALLCLTAGITSVGDALWLRPGEVVGPDGALNWTRIEDCVSGIARDAYVPGASYAVRVNRVDKSLPAKTQEMESRLGAAIRERTQWSRVDLGNPGLRVQVDAYPDGLYIYPGKHRGIGGLPVGTGGRVLALLSGGIDSPVAAFMLAKRGCSLDYLHFSAGHVPLEGLKDSVVARLACQLSRTALKTRLYVVPYTHFDLQLRGTPSGFELVLFRRFMMRCAEYLATRIGAGALVTGDSLGQVASQTLENLDSASRVVSLPILRPLVGMNKQEIIEIARRVDTFETSILPYKDCCALIARHPRTRSRHAELSILEDELFPDYPDLVRRTFGEALCLTCDCGELVDAASVEI